MSGEAGAVGRRCPSCGARGAGRFCTRCGDPLSGEAARCAECGARLRSEDAYCGECGTPARGGRRGARGSRWPWILSVVALVAFSVGIAFLVQRSTSPRLPGDTMTGGIPSADGGEATAGGSAPEGSSMPSAADLAAMSPREAADRLFDRAMTEGESGDPERARFFARMGLQAYGQVPAAEMDDDAYFHVGLLHLAGGDVRAARDVADLLLEERARHLYGLVLALRAAATAGETEKVAEARDRLEAAIAAGESPEEPPYAPHAALIRREATGNGG